jgi:endoglucanase
LQELKDVFLELSRIGSPSGFEEAMMQTLKVKLEPCVDQLTISPRGNVIGTKNGVDPQAPSIAIVAHMDQVGFIVSNIDREGTIRFRKLGGPVTRAIQGQHLRLLTENNGIIGVVGIKPGHITRPEEEKIVPDIEKMYIDIGTATREDTEKRGVTIGTPIVYNTPPVELANNLMASPAVDNKAGCTALLAIAKALQYSTIPSTVHYIGSIEEEIGLRGAEVVLHNLQVDVAIAIDTFPAGWQPDVVMKDLYYEVGKGPGIHIGHIAGGKVTIEHPIVRKWLQDTANQEKIPYQTGLMHGRTDSVALMQTKMGIPSATVGLPRKYSHSPIEVFSFHDLENLIKLLTTAIQTLPSQFTFDRI